MMLYSGMLYQAEAPGAYLDWQFGSLPVGVEAPRGALRAMIVIPVDLK
jgi:hypothetical protein